MLRKLVLLAVILPLSTVLSFGQILNGSFENGSGPDLTGWQSTCGAQSEKSAPAGGGDFCLRVFSGNTQGCWPGYAFQKLPQITDGQAFTLSGWAYALTSQRVGLYFGKINKGVITLLEGDTTGSTSWKQLTVKSEFKLAEGDTALLVLYGGLTGGPVQGYGFFDLIELQPAAGINTIVPEQQIHIFSDPVSSRITVQTEMDLRNVTISIIDTYSRTIKLASGLKGRSITVDCGHLPAGLYVVRLVMDNKIIARKKLILN